MTPANITVRNDMSVDLVDHMGDDDSVLRAMLISTLKDEAVETMEDDGKFGRINFLMKGRHGTPFEHNSMTFRVEAPIFVFREWHRHRVGISINEQSGRYVELPPMFYVPSPERPVKQTGKPGAYQYVADDPLNDYCFRSLLDSYKYSYTVYDRMLRQGVAKEVARMCLPVAIYSSMYWTCNARSLMAFLSLRTRAQDGETAMFPSTPMFEIDNAARQMEEHFSGLFPLTHRAFNEHGRVAP